MNEFKGYFNNATSFIGELDTAVVEIQPKYESIEIMPTTETQVKEGSYNKVTVAGDKNLKAENISKGTSIFGVEGTANTTSIKITDASRLFYSGARIEYLNDFLKLCENVTKTNYMFESCMNLTELDLTNFDTSNVTNMESMFASCSKLTELDLSNFNTSKVTEMRNMFSQCNLLETIIFGSGFDTKNVENMQYMFSSCRKITNINLSNFNTDKLTNTNGMFNNCNSIADLDLSNFDLSKVNSVASMLGGMTALTNLKSFKNLGKAFRQKSQNYTQYKFDISKSTSLTHESLIDLLTNGLYDLNLTYDVVNGGTLYRQSLVLGSTNLAKLTAEEIAIATNKGWNVS